MKKSLFLIVTLFLIGCTTVSEVPIEKQCTIAEDCVKAVCCHASEVVNAKFGPDCAGNICTQECVPGTLDCNQGEIDCVANECVVVLKE